MESEADISIRVEKDLVFVCVDGHELSSYRHQCVRCNLETNFDRTTAHCSPGLKDRYLGAIRQIACNGRGYWKRYYDVLLPCQTPPESRKVTYGE